VGRGLISEDVINQVRDRVDIAEVVGHHVSLTRAGQNLKGLSLSSGKIALLHGQSFPPDLSLFRMRRGRQRVYVFDADHRREFSRDGP